MSPSLRPNFLVSHKPDKNNLFWSRDGPKISAQDNIFDSLHDQYKFFFQNLLKSGLPIFEMNQCKSSIKHVLNDIISLTGHQIQIL